MRFIASFADSVIASVESVSISFTYASLLEGSLEAFSRSEMAGIEEHMALIEAGILVGYYCFEPVFMEEKEFWDYQSRRPGSTGLCLKDNFLSALLHISDKKGRYSIILEWYSSTKELTETPIPVLVQQYAGQLNFKDIRKHCKFAYWEELE